MSRDVLLCSVDEERWAQLPATLDAPIADGALLDDPEEAALWHAAWTWRATGDAAWWPHTHQPQPPVRWCFTDKQRDHVDFLAELDAQEVGA